MNLAELRSHVPLVNIPKKKKLKKVIRKVSRKRKPVNAEYMKLRAEFLEAHPYCQVFMQEHGCKDETEENVIRKAGWMDVGPTHQMQCPRSTEIHHKKGRGKYLLDTSTWMAVSSEGHKAIHADPKTSYAKGYMLPRR